ncbi:MAG: glycosyltransferase family 4 protein [Acidobacteriaceae bacterium]|nr:glycosyltransferase family 4 protein [Acidobacteriaceae bacterium]
MINRRSYRIVHMTSAHGPFDQRIFHKECRSLARAGYEVVELGNYEPTETIDGVRVKGLGLSSSRLQRMTIKLCAICQEAFRSDGDAYHIHDPELLIAGLLLRAAGKRVVYDIHEDVPRDVLSKNYIPKFTRMPLMWVVELVENAAARCMSGLIPATPTIAERFYVKNNNTVVVNNYPDLDEFHLPMISKWESRSPAVAYIGGISEQRGIHQMLAAMNLLPKTLGVRLELAGWSSIPELETELAASKQWQHIRWHGELDRNGIASLLGDVRAGLVLLHPEKNLVVAQPVKLFEYMAAGIPVIASDFPLWRKIIEEAGCGLLVNPFDTLAIAQAIEHLITAPDEAEAMGQRGRKAVERHFSWANEEKTLLSFYASLLTKNPVVEKQAAVT